MTGGPDEEGSNMTIIEAALEVQRRKCREIERRGMPMTRLSLMDDSDLFFEARELTSFDLVADDWHIRPMVNHKGRE